MCETTRSLPLDFEFNPLVQGEPKPALEISELPTLTWAPTYGKERLDVWLWAIRKYKTRSLATSACKAGHARVNGAPAKPSSPVRRGDVVSIRKDGFDFTFQVVSLPDKRTSAPLAQECYVDLSAPRPQRKFLPALPVRDKGSGRPTKKQRRELDRLRGHDTNIERC